MAHKLGAFPLDATGEDETTGFHRMALSIGNYIGPFPGENVEVLARRLSDYDVLIKVGHYSRDRKFCISYRHIRFGYLSWRERLRSLWTDIQYGSRRYWFESLLPKTDWQHIPRGTYETPWDDCSRTMMWQGVIGISFEEYGPDDGDASISSSREGR